MVYFILGKKFMFGLLADAKKPGPKFKTTNSAYWAENTVYETINETAKRRFKDTLIN